MFYFMSFVEAIKEKTRGMKMAHEKGVTWTKWLVGKMSDRGKIGNVSQLVKIKNVSSIFSPPNKCPLSFTQNLAL